MEVPSPYDLCVDGLLNPSSLTTIGRLHVAASLSLRLGCTLDVV